MGLAERDRLTWAARAVVVPGTVGPDAAEGWLPGVRRVKLVPPRPYAGSISRPKVEAKLARAAELPLALVVAPAGFGKTSLLSGWARSSTNRVAWLSVDAADDLPRFTRHAVAALRSVCPGAAPAVDDLLSGMRDLTPDLVAEVLADDLLDLAEDVVFVIDDLHAAGVESVEMLGALLRYPSPTLRIVVGSRGDLAGLGLDRLRALGQVGEIREADLRFDAEEVGRLLGVGSPWLPEEVLARTDGWAAGVRALSLAGRASGLPESVRSYLRADVLAGQPEPLVALLRDGAVAERLTPALASALTGGRVGEECAAAILAEAASRGLFVVAIDDDGAWWRIHPLLREVLLEDLRRREGASAVTLRQERAARWHAAAGDPLEAVDFALRAGAAQFAADLLAQSTPTWLRTDRFGTLAWVDRLPSDMVEAHPALLVARASSRVWRIDYSGARDDADAAERLLAATGEMPESDRQMLMREIVRVRGNAFPLLPPDPVLLDQLRRLLDEPPSAADHVWHAVPMLWAYRMVMAERWPEARSVLERLAIDRRPQSDELAFNVIWVLAAFQLRNLELPAARLSVDRARSIVGPTSFFAIWLDNMEGAFLWETGDLAATIPSSAAALRLRHAPLHHVRVMIAARWAGSLLIRGQVAEARVVAAAERRRLELVGARHLLSFVDAVEAEIALSAGDLEAAERWADAPSTPPAIEGSLLGNHPDESRARVWLARGAPGDAAATVELLERLGERYRAIFHRLGLARMLPLLAGAQASAGDARRSVETMREALRIEPGEMTLRFSAAVAGERARDVLAAVAADASDPLACRAARMLSAGVPVVSRVPVPSPLTAREAEIVGLMARWLTDKEIAAQLGISVRTAHHHVENILRKLGVGDRRTAVVTAIEAGWIVPESRPQPAP